MQKIVPVKDSTPLQAIAEAIEESLPLYLYELELISNAVAVAFDRLKKAIVTLLKGVTGVLPTAFNPSERPRPQGSWLT